MGCKLCSSKNSVQTLQSSSRNEKKHCKQNDKDKPAHEIPDDPLNRPEFKKLVLEKFVEVVSDPQFVSHEKKVLASSGVEINYEMDYSIGNNEGEKLQESKTSPDGETELQDKSQRVTCSDLIASIDFSIYDNIVLAIGDSGSGKSSFINLVHNQISENRTLDSIQIVSPTVNWPEKSLIDNPVCRESGLAIEGNNSAFTREIKLVTFSLVKKNRKILFIDTPGFCRNGDSADVETALFIVTLMSQLPRLDTVLYVHKATETTFAESLKQTLAEFSDILLALQPKLIAIYTFAGSKLDVKHDSLPFPKLLVQKKYHALNNLTFALSREILSDHKKLKANQTTYEQTLGKVHSFIDSL